MGISAQLKIRIRIVNYRSNPYNIYIFIINPFYFYLYWRLFADDDGSGHPCLHGSIASAKYLSKQP